MFWLRSKGQKDTRPAIERSLGTLVLVAVLPLLVFGGGVAWLVVDQEKAAVATQLSSTASALQVALDRELLSQFAAMKVLATDASLDAGNLPDFTNRARRILKGGHWRNTALIDPQTHSIVASGLPLTTPEPTALPAEVDEVTRTRQPKIVGVLAAGKLTGETIILFLLPVIRNDEVRYVLSAAMSPKTLSDLFVEQRLSVSWTGAILDRQLTLAGRSRDATRFIGKRATPALAEHLAASQSGMFVAPNLEGDSAYTAFSRSPATGWSVVIGVPASAVEGPIIRRLTQLAAAGAALIAFALILAGFVGRGIVRRRYAYEKSLFESQSRLNLALSGADMATWDWPIPVGALVFSARGAEILGYTQDELATRIESWESRLFPDAQTQVREKIALHFKGDALIYESEHRVRHKDGHWIWLLVKGKVVEWDAAGNPVRAMGTALDITERKQTEAKIATSEALLRCLIHAIPDLVFLKDPEGVYLSCNRRFERFFGALEKDIVGKTDYDFVEKNIADSFRANDRAVMENSEPSTNQEWIVFADDGHRELVETTKTPIFDAHHCLLGVVGVSHDVTARKAAEASVLRNESRLRSLVTILQRPSESIQDFLDHALEQAIDLTDSQIGYIYQYHEERQEFVLNAWSKGVMPRCAVTNPQGCYALEQTGIWGEAIRQRQPIVVNDFTSANPLKKGVSEGHVPLLKFMTVPIFQDGIIVGVIGLGNKKTDYLESDILQTSLLMEAAWKVIDRKRVALALKASEEFGRSVLDSMAAQIAVLDRNGTIVTVNDAWRRFALENAAAPGTSPRNTESGVSYLKVCQASTGDSLSDGQQAHHGIQKVLDGRLPNFSFEYPCHSPSQKRWFTMSVTAINGDAQGVVIAHTDITGRKMAEIALQDKEEKYRLIFENAGDMIIIHDLKARILSVNPVACEHLGFTRDELLTMNVGELSTPEAAVQVPHRIAQLMAQGQISFEIMSQRKDGSTIPSEVSARRITWEASPAIMLICRDISAHKRYQLELLAARDVAEAANKSKDTFLANVSHELRTPLSAVIGMAGLARGLGSDPQQQDYLTKISSAGRHLNRLINDLLDLSKIGAGRMEFETVPFSLRQLVTRSSAVIRYKADEKTLQLVETIADEIPDVLLGDAMRLQQILFNLLSNAVKFTSAGRVALRIGLHLREAQRVCLNIEVEDTGIGMREEEIGLLFKPFSQADVSMTRKFGGTGLGLAISKHLAEMMDGGIRVSSREGQGTTFHVQLWLGLGQDGQLPDAEAHAPVSRTLRYRDVRVLVVDDQPFNRDVVAGLLAVVGIDPDLASNGREALDLLTHESKVFDLVLMDIQMPVMDGLTATRKIRQMSRFSTLPIIAMTAHTMTHEKMNSVAAGMNGHIGKPFDEEGFYRVLEKWIPISKRDLRDAAADHSLPVTSGCGVPPLHGVDVQAGLALMQGNEARYRQWLGVFIDQVPATLVQIRDALAAAEPEPASMAAHTLKGSTGLLGMNELHACVAALETAIDHAEPTEKLMLDLEQGIAAMCAEIKCKLGLENAAPALKDLAEKLPPGLLPACITQLIEGLDAGDGNCDRAIEECLAELKDTEWTPHLRLAQSRILNFDYADAIRELSGDRQ